MAAGTGKVGTDSVHAFPRKLYQRTKEMCQVASNTFTEVGPFGVSPSLDAPLRDPGALHTQQPHAVADPPHQSLKMIPPLKIAARKAVRK